MPTSARPIYEQRYVAFIDILGFSDVVRWSTVSNERAMELLHLLEMFAPVSTELATPSEGRRLSDFRALSFSDCVVFSTSSTELGLDRLLEEAADFSFQALTLGITVRGGIAKGLMHHGSVIAFGPAMIDAYSLEKTVAKYPRIVVDQVTHQDYRELHSGLGDLLQRGEDGIVFVDTLSTIRRLPNSWPSYYWGFFGLVCHDIEQQLMATRNIPKVREKLRWFATYWNQTVRTFNRRDRNRFGLATIRLSPKPTPESDEIENMIRESDAIPRFRE